MPLLPGKKNVGHNIAEMELSGHPRDVAIAAALHVARKARADGGGVTPRLRPTFVYNGKAYEDPRGHHMGQRAAREEQGGDLWPKGKFMFKTEKGKMLDRQAALEHALAHNMITDEARPHAEAAYTGKSTGWNYMGAELPAEWLKPEHRADGGEVDRSANLAKFMEGNHPDVPNVLYHGTSGNFDAFKKSGTGEFGPGVYFTDSPNEASAYTTTNERDANAGHNIIPVHVSLKNPFIVKNDPLEFWNRFRANSDEESHRKAIAAGHDGVIYKRPVSNWDDKLKKIIPTGEMQTHVVVFHPHQIKSAIGNRGTFDPREPDITKARGGFARAAGGRTATHLPFPDSLNIPTPPTKADMDRHARRVDVPLHTARATQTAMDWRKPGERTNPGPMIPGYEDAPVAVRKETGEHLIFDGHHRTVSAINSGRQSMPMHVIDAKHYDPENAGRPPMRHGMSDEEMLAELDPDRQARASGGSVHEKLYTGPIHSPVAGRTDHLPVHVPSGSYVIPADVVSAHGEGNTVAGFKVMRRIFGGTPYKGSGGPYNQSGGPYGQNTSGTPYGGSGGPYNEKLAQGGSAGSVPVIVAGGEMILDPDQVRAVGEGDLDTGHKVLDEFVKRSRKELIKTLTKLPGPKKD
jgi:hypothetical protein